MIVLKKNILSSIMHLFQKTPRSAHVRLSERAIEIFKNPKTGNDIIKAISENKTKISEGGVVIVKTHNDTETTQVSIERVSEKNVDRETTDKS